MATISSAQRNETCHFQKSSVLVVDPREGSPRRAGGRTRGAYQVMKQKFSQTTTSERFLLYPDSLALTSNYRM